MHTMGDVRGHTASILHAFTPKIAAFLLRASLGVGEEEVEAESQGRKGAVATIDSFFPHAHAPAPTAPGDVDPPASPTTREVPKSLGHRRTFALDCRSAAEQRAKLQELCDMVAASLKEKHLHGLTATLTLKTSAFEETARAATAECHVQSAASIHRLLRPLLDAQVAVLRPPIPWSVCAPVYPPPRTAARLVRAEAGLRVMPLTCCYPCPALSLPAPLPDAGERADDRRDDDEAQAHRAAVQPAAGGRGGGSQQQQRRRQQQQQQ